MPIDSKQPAPYVSKLLVMFAAAISGLSICAVVAVAQSRPDVPSSLDLHRAQQEVFRAAIASIAPSIVRIETIGGALPVRRSRDGKTTATVFRQADGPTTGLIWSADGYIVTSSFNFIRDPRVITVTLHDGSKLLARLVARDRPARLALLKVDSDRPLAPPKHADSDRLRPGQWALAAGHGFGGKAPAMSVGIISALHRKSGLAIQTDAKISPANYGGPLVDIAGAVIGVCVPMGLGEDETAGVEWYDSGISFAVGAERIRAQFDKLKRGEDVHRGLMGVNLENSDNDLRGVPITATPIGPAAAAGLQEGDVIVSIDARATPTFASLRSALAQRAAGDAILVGYLRDGTREDTGLTLVRRDELTPASATQPADEPSQKPTAKP